MLEGEQDLVIAGDRHPLGPGGFAYLPAGSDHSLTAMGPAKAAMIEKTYAPIADGPAPSVIIGNESSLAEVPLMGDSSRWVRSLIAQY